MSSSLTFPSASRQKCYIIEMSSEMSNHEHDELLKRLRRLKSFDSASPDTPSPPILVPSTSDAPYSQIKQDTQGDDDELMTRWQRLCGEQRPAIAHPPMHLPSPDLSESEQFDQLIQQLTDEIRIESKIENSNSLTNLEGRLERLKPKQKDVSEQELQDRFNKIGASTASTSNVQSTISLFQLPMKEEDEVAALVMQAIEAARLEQLQSEANSPDREDLQVKRLIELEQKRIESKETASDDDSSSLSDSDSSDFE